MRFLCLHGLGTNSKILETQIGALRYLIGGDHEYDFVDGSIPWPAARGIEATFGKEECYTYFDGYSASSILAAVDNLAEYISSDGPFDAVIGFSQGAALAATLIVRNGHRTNRLLQNKGLLKSFNFAIFLSGGQPFDSLSLERGEVRQLEPSLDGEVIDIPTAHFWGINDVDYPGSSHRLAQLCNEGKRVEVVHNAGHGMPSTRADLTKMVEAFHVALQKSIVA